MAAPDLHSISLVTPMGRANLFPSNFDESQRLPTLDTVGHMPIPELWSEERNTLISQV